MPATAAGSLSMPTAKLRIPLSNELAKPAPPASWAQRGVHLQIEAFLQHMHKRSPCRPTNPGARKAKKMSSLPPDDSRQQMNFPAARRIKARKKECTASFYYLISTGHNSRHECSYSEFPCRLTSRGAQINDLRIKACKACADK